MTDTVADSAAKVELIKPESSSAREVWTEADLSSFPLFSCTAFSCYLPTHLPSLLPMLFILFTVLPAILSLYAAKYSSHFICLYFVLYLLNFPLVFFILFHSSPTTYIFVHFFQGGVARSHIKSLYFSMSYVIVPDITISQLCSPHYVWDILH